MSSPNFLVVNEQAITLEQALNYLKVAGKFQPFLLEVLSQYAINQELQTQPDLQISAESLEQLLIDFRVERELIDPQAFQAWLDSNGISYEAFRQRYVWQLTHERLKVWLSQSRLQTYFDQRKPFLDQVLLSWVVTDTKELATSLRHQLEAGTRFKQLTDELATPNLAGSDQKISHPLLGFWKRLTKPTSNFSHAELPVAIAIEEPLSPAELPEELREAIDEAQPGSLMGPVLLDDGWYVFRVDEFLPAELDADLEAQLRDEIFAQWLTEQVSAMNVKLEVN